MKNITYRPDYRKVGQLSTKGHVWLENESQKHLYALLQKGVNNSVYGYGSQWADEFTIWVLRDKKMDWETRKVVSITSAVITVTGFVSEFNVVEGQNGWHLYLTNGKEWIYHNDHDETEYDQLLCVRINRKKVNWTKNIGHHEIKYNPHYETEYERG